MKPFYQGKIDTFCAIYAVLNSLRITHSIRTLKARDYFNEVLLELAKNTNELEAVLLQTTDYVQLVDRMLEHFSQIMPLYVNKPFTNSSLISVEQFWKTCQSFINQSKNSTVIFRFIRYFDPKTPPIVRHWTCIETINDTIMHLYDSSHEAESIQNLKKNDLVTEEKDLSKSVSILVQPWSVRQVSLPY